MPTTSPRIVTHSCSNTEIVCALGMGHCLVGVDDHSDYPIDIVKDLPRIGPDQDIEVDKVTALRPDLVITSLTIPGHEQCVDRLQAAQLPMLVLEPKGLDDVSRDILAIATALDCRSAGQRLVEHFEAAMQAVDEPRYRPRILVEWWPKPVIVPGRYCWVTEMIARAGGVNPMGQREVKSCPVDDQQVLAWQPDAVVMSWCGVDATKYRPRVVRRRDAWKTIPALVHDHIFPVTEAWLGRPGPRLVQGMAALKKIISQVNQKHASGH